MDDLNLSTHTVKFTNIIYDIDSIVNKLKTSNNLEEIKDIIKIQHNIIFTYDNLINNNREGIQDLFTTPIFLDALYSVSGLLVYNISESEIIFINKIIYDYFEYSNSNNSFIKERLLAISYNININRIRGFIPFFGVYNARLLSIISYSSYRIEKVVHRINNFIVNSDIDIRRLDVIYFNIFGYMFIKDVDSSNPFAYNSILKLNNKFTNLFSYSMFEYCESKDIDAIKRFNKISKFFLDSIIEIGKDNAECFSTILITYNSMINLMNIDKNKLRFSIKEELRKIKDESLDDILEQINNIEIQNNISIY